MVLHSSTLPLLLSVLLFNAPLLALGHNSCAESLTSLIEHDISSGVAPIEPCKICVDRATRGPDGGGCFYCESGGQGGQSCLSKKLVQHWGVPRSSRCDGNIHTASRTCPSLAAPQRGPSAASLRASKQGDAGPDDQDGSPSRSHSSSHAATTSRASKEANTEAGDLTSASPPPTLSGAAQGSNEGAATAAAGGHQDQVLVDAVASWLEGLRTATNPRGYWVTWLPQECQKLPFVHDQTAARELANAVQKSFMAMDSLKAVGRSPEAGQAMQGQMLRVLAARRGMRGGLAKLVETVVKKIKDRTFMPDGDALGEEMVEAMFRPLSEFAESQGRQKQVTRSIPWDDALAAGRHALERYTRSHRPGASHQAVLSPHGEGDDDDAETNMTEQSPAQPSQPEGEHSLALKEACTTLAAEVQMPGISESPTQNPIEGDRADAEAKWSALNTNADSARDYMCGFIVEKSTAPGRELSEIDAQAQLAACRIHLQHITSLVITPCRKSSGKFLPVSPRYLRDGICGGNGLGDKMGVPAEREARELWASTNKPGWVTELAPAEQHRFTFGVEHEGSDLSILNIYRPSWIPAADWFRLCPADTQPCMENYQGCRNPCVPAAATCDDGRSHHSSNRMLELHCATFGKSSPTETWNAAAPLISAQAKQELFALLVSRLAQKAFKEFSDKGEWNEGENPRQGYWKTPPAELRANFQRALGEFKAGAVQSANLHTIDKLLKEQKSGLDMIADEAFSKEFTRIQALRDTAVANGAPSWHYQTPDDNPSVKTGVSWANYVLFNDLGLPELFRETLTEEVNDSTWEMRLPTCEPTVALAMFTVAEMQQMFGHDDGQVGRQAGDRIELALNAYHIHVVFPRPKSTGCDCLSAMEAFAELRHFQDHSFVAKACTRLHANDYQNPSCLNGDGGHHTNEASTGAFLANLAIGAFAIHLNDFSALIQWENAWTHKFMSIFDAATSTNIYASLTNGDFENSNSYLHLLEHMDINQHNWGKAKNAFVALRTPSVYGGDRIGLEIRAGVRLEPAGSDRNGWLDVLQGRKRRRSEERVDMALFLLRVVKTLRSFTADAGTTLNAPIRLSVQEDEHNHGHNSAWARFTRRVTVAELFMWQINTRARSMEWPRLRVAEQRVTPAGPPPVSFSGMFGRDRYGWDKSPTAQEAGHTILRYFPMDLYMMMFVARVAAQFGADEGPAACKIRHSAVPVASLSRLFSAQGIAPVLVKFVSDKMHTVDPRTARQEFDSISRRRRRHLEQSAVNSVRACLDSNNVNSDKCHGVKVNDHTPMTWSLLGELAPHIRRCYLSVVSAVSFAAVTTRRLATLVLRNFDAQQLPEERDEQDEDWVNAQQPAAPQLSSLRPNEQFFARLMLNGAAGEAGAGGVSLSAPTRRRSTIAFSTRQGDQPEKDVVQYAINTMRSWSGGGGGPGQCKIDDNTEESCKARLAQLIQSLEPQKLREVM